MQTMQTWAAGGSCIASQTPNTPISDRCLPRSATHASFVTQLVGQVGNGEATVAELDDWSARLPNLAGLMAWAAAIQFTMA